MMVSIILCFLTFIVVKKLAHFTLEHSMFIKIYMHLPIEIESNRK